jgi:hypothetical protein
VLADGVLRSQSSGASNDDSAMEAGRGSSNFLRQLDKTTRQQDNVRLLQEAWNTIASHTLQLVIAKQTLQLHHHHRHHGDAAAARILRVRAQPLCRRAADTAKAAG